MAQYDGSIRINAKILVEDAKKKLTSFAGNVTNVSKKISSKMDLLRSKMNLGKSMKMPTESLKDLEEEYSRLEDKIQKLAEKQYRFLAIGGKEGSTAYKGMEYDLDRLTEKQDEVLSKIRQIEGAESSMLGKTFGNTISLLKNGIKDIPIAAAKKGIEGLKAAFQGFGSIGKKSLSFIGSGIKKATSRMLGFGKSVKQSGGMLSTFGSRFKSLALSLLIFNQITKAFNVMVSGIKEGFSNLYNENSALKGQVDGLRASLLTMKNALAGAFAPIVQIAIPYIQQFVSWLTSAISAVGQFIAALTGRKTYIKAVQQTAGAFEDTAGAANDAKEAVEGYLNPLDEVNKYNDGKDKGAGAGGGGGAGGAGQMFEEVPIESRFQELVNKLKSFIKSEDWEGLGAFIASGINSGLQKIYDVINWNNVGPQITYFVNAFTRTFNSLVDNIDWDLLGRTIGAGINTFVNTMNLLIEGIDWKNLGKKFSEGIMGIVDEVNWENFGRFFGNKFMILWNTLYGLVMNLDYGKIGVAIGNGLNGAVNAINLGTIGATLGRALTGLFETTIRFADTFDWKALGDNISNGINRFFQEFDGKKFAQAATKLISGILDTLIEAISTTDWAEVWRDIIDFLLNVNWVELIGKLMIAAGQLIIGLVNGLVQAIAETDWGAVWDSIIQAFKDFFGIHSPSTVMKELGKYLIQGLFEGINSLSDTIKQTWQSMKETAVTIWNNTKEGLSTTWNNIKNNAKTVFDNVKTNISNAWNNAKQNTRTAWENMKSNAITAAQNIASNVKSKYENIKSSIKSFASSAKSTWNNTWSNMKNTVSSVLGTIKNTVSSAFSWISSKVRSIGSSLKNLFSKTSSSGSSRSSYSFSRAAYSIPSPYALYPEFSKINTAPIPKLATGAVIPANKEFLAVLGDQKHGTNIEAPLDTIKQAQRESILEVLSELGLTGRASNNNPQTIIIKQYLDGKQVAESVVKEGKVRQMATGSNMFMLGTT